MDAQALGRFLRQSREAKELTLEDAEQSLRIRTRILEAFELGEFQLPELSPIQVTGFIRNYARFLGLDDNLVIQYYESAMTEGSKRDHRNSKRGTARNGSARNKRQNKRETRTNNNVPIVARSGARSASDTNPKKPTSAPMSSSSGYGTTERERGGTGFFGWMFRIFVALASIAVIAFVGVQLIDLDSVPAVSTSVVGDGIFAQLPPTSSHTAQPTRTMIPATAVPDGLQQLYTGQGVLVTIQFRQRSWVRLLTDGNERYVGIAAPGTMLEYPAQTSIVLTASNAEALDVVYNGVAQPSFGDRGQRVDITFTQSNFQIVTGPGFDPTSEFTNTPIPTPTPPEIDLILQLTPTETPGPSPTPSDTPTETLTPTITDTPTETFTPSMTPTITETPTITFTPSSTFTPSLTPSITPIPSNTPIPTETPLPSPTAILPPRLTPTGFPPPK